MLVAEGEPAGRDYTVRLRAEGHAVDEVGDLDRAERAVADVDYDCVVVGSVGSTGQVEGFIADARQQRPSRPIVVIADDEGPDHRVGMLEAGADDLIVRPVSLDELALRVRKLIVRGTSQQANDRHQRLGRVALHRGRREVLVDDRPVALAPIQYALFECLLDNRGRIVGADELIQRGWDRNHVLRANPLPVQMSRLRKALLGAVRIEAIRGAGYRLVGPSETGAHR